MADEQITPVAANTTPVALVGTAPDYSAIIQQAAEKASTEAGKKFDAVLKSMVQQQQPTADEDTIKQMLAEFKANQKTPEQIAIEKFKAEYDPLLTATTTKATIAETENAQLKVKLIEFETAMENAQLTTAGYDGDLELYRLRVKKESPDKTFAEALVEYQAKYPTAKAAPRPATGTGTTKTMTIENEGMLAALKGARIDPEKFFKRKE